MFESKEINDLKRKIAEAFDHVDYSKGFITEHQCEECFAVRKTFLNKDWKQITPNILQENYDKLPLFSPEAFYCFLPAYLIYALDYINEDNEVYEFTCYQFMVRNDDEVERNSQRLISRFEHFTKLQIQLVLKFIDTAILIEDYDVIKQQF